MRGNVIGIKLNASTDLESPTEVPPDVAVNLDFDIANVYILLTFDNMNDLGRQKYKFKITWTSMFNCTEIWETLLLPLQMSLSASYWQLHSF
jgi:hypothetical protein